MVNWNCCSALCTNNHRTVLPDGSKVKYYRLPRDKSIQQQYTTILKTTGINFKMDTFAHSIGRRVLENPQQTYQISVFH